jgi:hypothetical protein
MGDYKPNKLVEDLINKKDIKNLRLAIGKIIYNDPSFKTTRCDDAIKYITEKCGLKQLIDSNNDSINSAKQLDTKKKYDDKDFIDEVFNLRNDFSLEHIKYIKELGKHIYTNNSQQEIVQSGTDIEEIDLRDKKKLKIWYRKKILTTIAVVASVIITVVLIIIIKTK